MDDDIAYWFGQNNNLVNPVIPHYDGNNSIDTASIISGTNCPCCASMADSQATCDSEQDFDSISPIPVHITQCSPPPNNLPQPNNPPVWYEEYVPRVSNIKESKANRKTIRRDDRLIVSDSLPILSVSNLRSLWPKLKNFKIDMKERNIGAAMLSEVWEKASCKKQQAEL